jgi:serine/threonine protein kinase
MLDKVGNFDKDGDVMGESYGIAKLIDFDCSTAESIDTKTKVVGTTWYMAPEVETQSNYTEQADVFSFGAVVGKAMFDDIEPTDTGYYVSLAEIHKATETKSPLDPDFFDDCLHPSLKSPVWSDLVTRLCAKNPNDRPASLQVVSGFRSLLEYLRNHHTNTFKWTIPADWPSLDDV